MAKRIPTLLIILLSSFSISVLVSMGVFILLDTQTFDDFIITQHELPQFTAIYTFILSFMLCSWLGTTWLARKRRRSLSITHHQLKQEAQERMLAEESKQKLEIALLQGQKLQAIGTLAGGIAHDFNNILYAIKGYTEIVREDTKSDPGLQKNLDKILLAAQRGQDLISRILAFSRKQHRDFKPLDLIQTIEAALALLRPTIPASVQIQFTHPDQPFRIFGDQTQLHQVLVNLINNAVDALDSEGNISISLTLLSKQEEVLNTLPKRIPSDYACLTVEDHGHGMDQTTLERIFEPFFTTKEVGKGTGLGLSIAHSIISEHQGHITAESQIGTGTTFYIYLPIQP